MTFLERFFHITMTYRMQFQMNLGKHFSGSNGENLTFLDIGAGYGFTTKLVAKVFPKAKFIVNEYDAELISRADAYLADYNYEKQIGDIEGDN
jgi:protein-L-isoaspartate O-methyltransferase